MNSPDQKLPVDAAKGIINLFLVIFLGVGAVLAGAITYIYQLQTGRHVERLTDHETFAVRAQTRIIDSLFADVVADLQFLSEQAALREFLDEEDPRHLEILKSEYFSLSRAKKNYDQIRFLDSKGMERARVDYNRGNPSVIPRADLQNKASRYYFKDTFALDRGQVFVSPLDLNIERHKVEKPFKPMIRFGMTVFDREGRKRGIVLINYLGDRFLKLLALAGKAMYGQLLLLNQDGYWLLGPRPEDAWGFMLPERKDKNLANRFPASAANLLNQDNGQFMNQEGMFSFAKIYPLHEGQLSSTGAGEATASSKKRINAEQYHWILVSHISPGDLHEYSRGLLFDLVLLGAGLFLLTAVASWLIAGSITRKRIHRTELFNMAHFDTLTGLPNRTMYFGRLTQIFETSRRHGRIFAILYIDLDDFKKVNDTLGHSAGDRLLQLVSQRMVDTVRKSDTVGRMGGDEFMLILTDLAKAGDAVVVAQKLLEVLTRPVQLGEHQAKVGACIGVAIFPQDSEDKDELIKMADQAMYACKEAGKNHYRLYSDMRKQPDKS